MKRRTALEVLAASAAAVRASAQHHLAPLASQRAAYQLRFFTPEQNAVLDRLTDIIIPADERSGGAHDAQVSLFIDWMVSHAGEAVKQEWQKGLEAVERDARSRFGRSFLQCTAEQQDQIVASMAAHEENPSTLLERFFVRLKGMTIDGYYTSRIGIHDDLRYQGNQVLAQFPGCTHPEHGGGP